MTSTQRLDLKAIEATIVHWRDDYKKLKLFGGYDGFAEVFNIKTCPLCGRWPNVNHCGHCPLRSRGNAIGCDHGSPYSNAQNAYRNGDKPAFMRARRNLLARLYRARTKLKGA